jgi:hypothetical protein
VAVRHPHPRPGPARRPPLVHRWVLLRILPAPAVFLLSIPFAIRQPVLGQYLWLLALVSSLVIRRLEPPETDPTTTGNGDPSKPR